MGGDHDWTIDAAECPQCRAERVVQVEADQMIAPVLDRWGRKPKSPAPSYVRFLNGHPAEWLTSENMIDRGYRDAMALIDAFLGEVR